MDVVDVRILARQTRLRTLLLMGLGLALAGACSSPDRTGEDAEPKGNLVAEGTFEGRENMNTTGTYRLERRDDRLYLALEKDFRTDSGPDLHVVLSPAAADTVTGSTAVPDGALIVDTLRSQTGPQNYELPKDIGLGDYRAVLIHCVKFAHLYGAAPINQ